jgi:CheY-like chemotaxis protein
VAARRVMLVDDDRAVRDLISHHLRLPRFELHAFAGATEALARIPELKPDIIVSDILMPDMDGRDFFRRVRADGAAKSIPFIFLTAVHSPTESAALREDGAEDYLVKPFPVARLVEKIQARLGPGGDDDLAPAVPQHALLPLPNRRDLRLQRGRFSSVDVGGERVQVLTEVQPGPRFAMVTVVTRKGRGVCRIETVWRNPLRRAEDFRLAARQLDFEHERTLQSLAGLVSEGRPRAAVWRR